MLLVGAIPLSLFPHSLTIQNDRYTDIQEDVFFLKIKQTAKYLLLSAVGTDMEISLALSAFVFLSPLPFLPPAIKPKQPS